MDRVERLNGVHLVAAAAVPMLGVLLMTIAGLFSGGEPKPAPNDVSTLEVAPDGEQKWPLLAVSAGGLAWLAIVWSLKRTIELDIAALRQIALEEPRRGSGAHRSSSGRSSARR